MVVFTFSVPIQRLFLIVQQQRRAMPRTYCTVGDADAVLQLHIDYLRCNSLETVQVSLQKFPFAEHMDGNKQVHINKIKQIK